MVRLSISTWVTLKREEFRFRPDKGGRVQFDTLELDRVTPPLIQNSKVPFVETVQYNISAFEI